MDRSFTIRGFNSETGRQVIQYNDNGEWAEIGGDKTVHEIETKIVGPSEDKAIKPVNKKRK